jgi:hypothetical protein
MRWDEGERGLVEEILGEWRANKWVPRECGEDSTTFACYMCCCDFDGQSADSGGHSAGARVRVCVTAGHMHETMSTGFNGQSATSDGRSHGVSDRLTDYA